MAVAEIPAGPVDIVVRKERSLFQQSIHRLLQNKIAVISLIFLVILFISGVYYRPVHKRFSGSAAARSLG